jgi:hypothetical protein
MLPASLVDRSGSLIDLLGARGRALRANSEVISIVYLELTIIREELPNARILHCVAGIGDALYVLAGIGVIPTAYNIEGLLRVSALYILLICLEKIVVVKEAVVIIKEAVVIIICKSGKVTSTKIWSYSGHA